MRYSFMRIILKNNNLYYFVLVLIAVIIPIIHYPRIYGVDAFQVIWMANALREGALFSDNTWLIHPASFFGYYPFSHRAIGIPIILAFLISFMNIISFGILGIPEAILAYNIILLVIIYISSRKLANRLFKEEWSRFIFVAAILLSPNIIEDTTMTVSTRIIITITMILLLNLNLKVISYEIHNKYKTIVFFFLILLVGALTHRLWMGTLITLIFMIFIIFIRKYRKSYHITFLLILPSCIIAFFYGLEVFWSDVVYQLGENANLLDVITFLVMYTGFWAGLLSICFPIGVIVLIYKFTFSFEIFRSFKISPMDDLQSKNSNLEEIDKFYYLSIFLVPFFFMIFTSFYTLVIFLPIIIFFSVQGLIYIRKLISRISKRLDWILPLIFIFSITGYHFMTYGITSGILVWNIFIYLIVALILFLSVFLIYNCHNFYFSKPSFNTHKFIRELWILTFTVSLLIYSEINLEVGRLDITNNAYPWENRFLTTEEIEIIEYLQNADIDDLIFVTDRFISERIGAIGFLPTFSDNTLIGLPLYYGIVSSRFIHENTEFSLAYYYKFKFYTFTEIDPIGMLVDSIKPLDIENNEDFNTLISYNVQYIITINNTFQPGGINNWPLIKSLRESSLFESVFSTHHLIIWKIY